MNSRSPVNCSAPCLMCRFQNATEYYGTFMHATHSCFGFNLPRMKSLVCHQSFEYPEPGGRDTVETKDGRRSVALHHLYYEVP